MFFSITDFLPAYSAYHLLAQGSSPSLATLRASLAVSITHIILALWDQGAVHIIEWHNLVARDLMFFASDVAGVLMVLPYAKATSGRNWKRIGRGVAGLSIFYQALKLCVSE